ncbi:MarR family transcriptional regulator [Variovorax dokdonensis]|uniref:MarR family transcriptional regulator n=1 Tax=Variovorax dokdonensis TaxID=344883 RepID=A0ABT7NCR2_9BURK|nr:MarR family transcriptional regulator [Variovorax dokdonensis]MDM0045635.1 MarR family transcriptional regulator [Variovorax dokdonensis]
MDTPNLRHPASIFDLLNFRVSEFYGLSGSLVTRMCEGEFGVTREEWQFVAMLATLGCLSPSDLAARTTVDRSQTSKTLRTLLSKELIFRETDRGDGRKAKVGLTKSGEAFYAMVFPRVVAIHKAMLSRLDEKEIEVLANCLRKMQETAVEVTRSNMVAAQSDRRHGGSKSNWTKSEMRPSTDLMQYLGAFCEPRFTESEGAVGSR